MTYVFAVIACLFFWWVGTAVLLRLADSSNSSRMTLALSATGVAVLAFFVLYEYRDVQTVSAAYWSFGCALVVWGWLELLHYLGFLLGPRITPCPAELTGIKRFKHAVQAMLFHELAMLAGAVVMVSIAWGHANPTGMYGFLVLWVMRISAEINVYFGVANLPEQWLPKRLKYLMSYRCAKSWSFFFPVSVGIATAVAVVLFLMAVNQDLSAFQKTSSTLIASLLWLAIIEHWALVLPLKFEGLWSSVRRSDALSVAKAD